MTKIEFEILDELYFLIPFNDLKSNTFMDENNLRSILSEMIEKQWVAIFEEDDSAEIDYDNVKFKANFKSYYYLATKKGLIKHNSN